MAKEESAKKEPRYHAIKRAEQAERRRLINKSFKSRVRTAIRGLQTAIVRKDQAASQQQLNEVYSLLDKGVKKGVYKHNTASRTKARSAASVAKLA